MKIAPFTLVLMLIATICGGCNRLFQDCFSSQYGFELNVRAYPDTKTVSVNDTIRFIIDSPTQLLNNSDNKLVDYSGAENLGSAVSFAAIGPDTIFTVKGDSIYKFILSKGKESEHGSQQGSTNQYLFAEENGRYRFDLAIIPKLKGTYIVVFSNASNVYRRNDKCTKAGFTINFKDTDQHYPLNPFYTPGQILVGGDYYFEVK